MQDQHYKIMPLLFGLTIVSGLIDAASYLRLGHVFVANMTGNVVLLGFAIAGAPGISISGSLVALAFFMIGAVGGGKYGRGGETPAHVLRTTTVSKIVLMLLAAAVAFFFGTAGLMGYIVIAVLGVSMGLQNAAVRSLAVPDMTTTVVTQTITGIAADLPIAGGTNTRIRRRITTVIIMFAGALGGAFVTLRAGIPAALGLAALTLVIVMIWASRLTKEASWQTSLAPPK
jgi:uncharacterized membrane protein YoaK (UPF0700 family)